MIGDKPKVVMDESEQYAYFVSTAVHNFTSPDQKKSHYESYFTMYGKTAATGKILVPTRRAVCNVCNAHIKLSLLHYAKAHLLLHPHTLAYEDYSSKDIAALKELYAKAIKFRAGTTVPDMCTQDQDGRKRKSREGDMSNFTQMKKTKLDEFPAIFAKAVALGGFHQSLSENKGIQLMLKFALGVESMPAGISAKTVKSNCATLYKAILQAKKKDILISTNKHLPRELSLTSAPSSTVPSKLLHLIHDTWSTRFNKASLTGVKAAFMDSSNPTKLRIRSVVLGMLPVVAGHDAESTQLSIIELLHLLGLSINDIVSSVADNTGSAKNVFKDNVDIVNIGCFAHLLSLFLKHSLEGERWGNNNRFKKVDDRLKTCLQSIHEVSVKLSGSKLTLELLYEQERINDMPIMINPKCHFPVRWNSYEKCASTFQKIKTAVNQIETSDLYPNDHGEKKREKIATYNKNLDDINSNFPLLMEFLPFMNRIAEWTQVLSSANSVTISKVLVARQDILKQLDDFDTRAADLKYGRRASIGVTAIVCDAATKEVSKAMTIYVNIMRENMNHYFGEEFCDNELYQIASFLDPSTWMNLPSGVLKPNIVKEAMKKFCSDDENSVPGEEIEPDDADNDIPAFMSGPDVNRRSTTRQSDVALSLLHKEIENFPLWITRNYNKQARVTLDPLELYANNEVQRMFPILYRIALVVLPAAATSSDVERLFSLSGRIFSVARASMKSESGSMWVCLKSWLQEEVNEKSRRVRKAEESGKRFATLIASDESLLTISPATESIDEGEESLMLEEAERLQALQDKPHYEGDILLCPAYIPKFLEEGCRVAVYFEDCNKWYEGKLYHVNKRKKNVDNVAVLFDDQSNHTFCWNDIKQYGKDKDFVVIPTLINSPSIDTDDSDEE